MSVTALRPIVENEPANRALADHVQTYAGVLDAQHCRTLIERFETSQQQHEACEQESSYCFTQLDVTTHWPDQHQALVPAFLSAFARYQRALDARFWPPQFAFEHIRLKRYLPNGRDGFPLHVDVMTQAAARRFMTAIIYVNDVAGGETVFPQLDLSVAPKTGTAIVFPPLWLFPHAGLPPRAGAKYILHTYICYPS